MSETITAGDAALAIVAAATVTGLTPAEAFAEGPEATRTRLIAAAGCVTALGVSKAVAGRVFRVLPQRLAPSMLARAAVTTADLAGVTAALGGGKVGASPKAREPDRPREVAAAPAGRKTGARQVERVAAKVEAAPPADPIPPRAASKPRDLSRSAARAGEASAPRAPVRSRSPASREVQRLKPVTAPILRWARQQAALGADLDFVAWCFGVDADALADALEMQRAA